MSRDRYETHPAAGVFPMMSGAEFESFKEDIRVNGLQESITLWYDGRLIDGRNRYKACLELGIEPWVSQFELDEDEEEQDPYAWVLSKNLHRRHLNGSQRSMVAAEIAKLKRGEVGNGRKVEVQICTSTIEEAAEMLNVSRRSAANGKQVLEHGSQELIEAVQRGEVAVSRAAKVAKETPKREQLKAATEKPKRSDPKPKPKAKKQERVVDEPREYLLNSDLKELVMNADDKMVVARYLWEACDEYERDKLSLLWSEWHQAVTN